MKPATERIDPRYSAENAEAVPWTEAEARLAAAEIAWIVTLRPDGRPHATPMVPVVHDGKVYFHTGSPEVKYANLQSDPHVLVLAGDSAWNSGLDVAVEGTALPVTDDALLRRLAELYLKRWDGSWKLDVQDGALVPHTPGTQLVMFEVTPTKAYSYGKGDLGGQTTYRF
jgi:general stress protein 26